MLLNKQTNQIDQSLRLKHRFSELWPKKCIHHSSAASWWELSCIMVITQLYVTWLPYLRLYAWTWISFSICVNCAILLNLTPLSLPLVLLVSSPTPEENLHTSYSRPYIYLSGILCWAAMFASDVLMRVVKANRTIKLCKSKKMIKSWKELSGRVVTHICHFEEDLLHKQEIHG